MKTVKCPHCQTVIDHFEVIGAEDAARVCPVCHQVITDEQLASLPDESDQQTSNG